MNRTNTYHDFNVVLAVRVNDVYAWGNLGTSPVSRLPGQWDIVRGGRTGTLDKGSAECHVSKGLWILTTAAG